jgi:hypothetical protein
MASIRFLDGPAFRTKVRNKNFSILRIAFKPLFGIRIKQDLPFRIKFMNIGISSYGPSNVPPIGIAIIGFNNYIL